MQVLEAKEDPRSALDLLNELDALGYRRISKKIACAWGDPEGESYLETLINDTRNGTRQGFPLPVFDLILKLYLKHNSDRDCADLIRSIYER